MNKDAIKQKFNSTKTFVVENKKQILGATAAITVIAIQARGISNLNKFLKEKDLYDEYYFMSDEEN